MAVAGVAVWCCRRVNRLEVTLRLRGALLLHDREAAGALLMQLLDPLEQTWLGLGLGLGFGFGLGLGLG